MKVGTQLLAGSTLVVLGFVQALDGTSEEKDKSYSFKDTFWHTNLPVYLMGAGTLVCIGGAMRGLIKLFQR